MTGMRGIQCTAAVGGDGTAPRSALTGRRVVLPVLAIVALVAVTHGGALRNDFVGFDDPEVIYENPHVTAGLTADGMGWACRIDHATGYFQPLTWLSLMANAQVLGVAPRGFHLGNVLLHALNAALLFLVLARTLRCTGAPLAAAAIWASHPLTVEAVAWASERKAVLSTFFVLLAIHAWIAFTNGRRASRLILAVLLGTCAYLSKPATIVLPALLLIVDLWPLGRLATSPTEDRPRGVLVALAREKIPFALAAAIVLALALFSVRGFTAVGGAMPGLGLRSIHAIASIPTYLGATIWPVRLAVFRPYPSGFEWAALAGGGATLVGVTLLLWRFRTRYPAGLFGWAWFLVALFPYLGLKQAGLWPSWADRFAYLPLMGLTVAVAFGASAATAALGERRGPVCGALLAAVLVILGRETRAQVEVWRDSIALYEHSLRIEPRAYAIQFNYGKMLLLEGRREEARRALQQAVDAEWRMNEAQCDLGGILMLEGELAAAAERFELALRVAPDMPEALYNLAEVHRLRGDLSRAIPYYRHFLTVAPPELGPQAAAARAYLRQ